MLSVLCGPSFEGKVPGGSRFGNEPQRVAWLVGAADRASYLRAVTLFLVKAFAFLEIRCPQLQNEGHGSHRQGGVRVGMEEAVRFGGCLAHLFPSSLERVFTV